MSLTTSLDYPLETECNAYTSGDLHTSACEAAAAIRMVANDEHRQRLAEWLWANQASLKRDAIAGAAKSIGGVADFADEYPRVLSGIREDVEIAKALGVSGTPTYFVNGVRLPVIPPEDFERAIQYELRHAGTVVASSKSSSK
jgi:protein-disulfide isomerase